MGVQYEQHGTEIQFLQSQLRASTEGWGPISMKTPGQKTVSSWLEPWSPNAKQTLRSMIPNTLKQAQHLRITKEAAAKNLQGIAWCLTTRGYPQRWWRGRLLQAADSWGLKEQALQALAIKDPTPPQAAPAAQPETTTDRLFITGLAPFWKVIEQYVQPPERPALWTSSRRVLALAAPEWLQPQVPDRDGLQGIQRGNTVAEPPMPENPPPPPPLSLCHPFPRPLLEGLTPPYIGHLPPLILYYHLLPLLDFPSAYNLFLASKLTFTLLWEAMQVSARLEHLDRLWWRGKSLLRVLFPPDG